MSITVSVTLTEKEYALVETESKRKGLTIAQYVKRFPIGGKDFQELYEYLKEQAKLHTLNEKFTVMSIFKEDWNDIERGTKLSLGRCFYHLVKRGELPGVTTAGKNSSNIQLYVHKED